MTEDLRSKNWNCPKKLEARNETIIDMYKKLTLRSSIPENHQYWTISGRCAIAGKLLAGSELDQLIKTNFIVPDQFYGVEIDQDIFESNATLQGPTWIFGDFYQKIQEAIGLNQFLPAIINYDSTHYPQIGTEILAKLLKSVGEFCKEKKVEDVLVLGNFVVQGNRRTRITNSEIIQEFLRYKAAQVIVETNFWKLYDQCYIYRGTGTESRTSMATIIFSSKAFPLKA